MVVSRNSFDSDLFMLKGLSVLSLDTETTGLRPYHGDALFSIIIGYASPDPQALYFNFKPYAEDVEERHVLGDDHLRRMQELLSMEDKRWYLTNAKFDMAMLAREGLELAGEVHCTVAQGRVEYNLHNSYSLAASLERIGLKKDDAVEVYVQEKKLYDVVKIPGRTQAKKDKHFEKVPFSLIVPYAESDAKGTYTLGCHQEASIENQAISQAGVLTLRDVARCEKRLTKTVFKMERLGVRIDGDYCVRAARFEADRIEKSVQEFKRHTGKDYQDSGKLFRDVFASERKKWVMGEETPTGKINPSFSSEVLLTFEDPAAKSILTLRDAKSRLNFYTGFLYHADSSGDVHPTFNPSGARTTRFSSAEPNLQNLTSEEDETELAQEFVVRRAFVPRPGFIFIMPDYDQMEYRMMLDIAKHMCVEHRKLNFMPLDESLYTVANQVRDGFDVHQATADLIGFPRKIAKNINFGILYGQGVQALADAIGKTFDEAKKIRTNYFKAMPYVREMIVDLEHRAGQSQRVEDWMGGIYHFPDSDLARKAPNAVVQGGCAKVMKGAMNAVDDYLTGKKSRLVLTVHDELVLEVAEDEVGVVPQAVKELMESVYPHHYVPLPVSLEWSRVSLADKVKGLPV